MTRTNNKRLTAHALPWVLSLFLVLAICLSTVSLSFATSDKFVQTVIITQELKNDPVKTDYTYELTPLKSSNPMPDDGVTKWRIKGATTSKTAPSFTITFDATKPGNYQYRLSRIGTVPSGDVVTPDEHIFGFLVEQDENGNMVIIPYTCYDNYMEIWDEVDSDGNPLGLTLVNKIHRDGSTPGKDGKDGQDGSDGKDGKDGQSCTCKDDKNGCSCDTKSDGCTCSGTCNCSKCADDKTTTTTKNGSGTTNNNSSNNSGSNSSSNGSSSSNRSSGTSGTTSSNVVTRTVNKIVNTGDPYQVGLWLGLIVVSGAALIILLVVRRKQDDEEETL